MARNKKKFNGMSPLSTWIDRKAPLSARFYRARFVDRPHHEWPVWVAIEESSALHAADDLDWLSLVASRKKTGDYLREAGRIIRGLSGWLDRDEQEMILEEIGDPPIPCLPIYIISVGSGEKETVAYVGKTKTKSRFSGGHPVALKLHEPKYRKLKKTIYRCSIWFSINDEYIALEWLRPEDLSETLLSNIEAQLIYSLQPLLNTQGKKKYSAKIDFCIHIQNMTKSKLLNDTFIYGDAI